VVKLNVNNRLFPCSPPHECHHEYTEIRIVIDLEKISEINDDDDDFMVVISVELDSDSGGNGMAAVAVAKLK
jgi:hypothetical protein